MDQDPADVRARALWFDRKRKRHCFGFGTILATDQINCTVKPLQDKRSIRPLHCDFYFNVK